MKKLLVIACVVVMVMGMAAMASASAADWTIKLKAGTTSGGNAAAELQIGTTPGAADGLDSLDAAASPLQASTAYVRCFDLGAGSASMGYYLDFRAPITSGIQTWNLTFGTGSTFASSVAQLRLYNPAAYDIDGTLNVMRLTVVEDATGTYAAGTKLIDLWDATKAGSSTSPAYKFDFASANLLSGGVVKLKLEAGFVPEPGSMVAMASGLVGLVGFGIRRRK